VRFFSATTSNFGAISLGCITLVTHPGKGGVGIRVGQEVRHLPHHPWTRKSAQPPTQEPDNFTQLPVFKTRNLPIAQYSHKITKKIGKRLGPDWEGVTFSI
jgi:hypothetical protein